MMRLCAAPCECRCDCAPCSPTKQRGHARTQVRRHIGRSGGHWRTCTGRASTSLGPATCRARGGPAGNGP
eukprot:4506305-Prymnesium_polylepis.1